MSAGPLRGAALPLPAGLPADLVSEGASYAVEFLRRVTDGTATPADFAAVVGFLQCHPMLIGFACVIVEALRQALAAQRETRH